MFGTLSVQPKASLTFVENPNLASVLSRNRRDKPHVSCELCRARKTRCSGDPSGCDKCLAVSAECRYPSRDTRRKKRGLSSVEHEVGTSSNTNNASQDMQCRDGEHDLADSEATHRLDSAQSGGVRLQGSAASLDMFNVSESNLEQQHIEQWLSSNPASSSAPVVGDRMRFDEWPDMNSFLDPALMSQFDALADDVDALDEQHNDVPLEDTECRSDTEDDGYELSSRMYPNPGRPMQAPMASLNDALAPSKHHQSAASSSRSSDSNKDLHTGHDLSGYMPVRNGWSSLSQMSYNRGRRAVTLEERRKPQNSRTSTPRHRTSGRESSTSTASCQSKGDGCRCLNHTVHLLEELGSKSANSNAASMDVFLGLLRNAIAHCTAALDCERCQCRGETNTLLAIACQYMSDMYERVVKGCVRMLETMVQNRERNPCTRSTSSPGPGAWPLVATEDSDSGGTSNDRSSDGADDMWFSTYRIESNCERMHVLTTIVTVQTTEFAQVLGQLKLRAGGRTSRMAILIEAEKRTNLVRRMLKSSIDRATASKEQEL